MPSLNAELISEVSELEEFAEPWRALAHACARPGALPDWQLAWFRHAAPSGALLRSVTVREGERLVGLAPFFAMPGRRLDYRLLGAGITHRLSPLAYPGTEQEVAGLVAETLASARPRPDLIAFEGIDAASPWPDAVARNWPGLRPWRYTSSTHPGPVIELRGQSFESWLSSRSSKLREAIRRARRRFEGAGGRALFVKDPAELEHVLAAFERLHRARWSSRGGSNLEAGGYEALAAAARTLVARDGMRLCSLHLGGRPVAINIALAGAGEVMGLCTSFDQASAALQPGLVAMAQMIEHAFSSSDRRFDFGAGDSDYKVRLSTHDAPVSWIGLVPRTRRYAVTRVRLAPDQTRWLAARVARRLPRSWRMRIKRVLRRD
jgi:CelD/BcsL family acetyltransferase involved in cellulose biosynthesis